MEIRNWFNQQLVNPTDMRDSTGDMYQRNYDMNNFPPVILWGLHLFGIIGNTVTFTIGAARAPEITVATYPYLPAPIYGTGYPGIIEIPATHNSITLDTGITPCFIVATYSISPTSPGQALYTTTGNLAQVTSVDTSKEVILAHAVYSGSWAVDLTPGTHRDYDMSGLSAIQFNLTDNIVEIGDPQGLSTVEIDLNSDVVVSSNLAVRNSIYDGAGYLLNTSQVDVPTTLTPINALVSGSTMVRFTGILATVINGIVAGISSFGAQPLTVYNESSASIIFMDNSGSATAPDRIKCPAGNITLAAGFCLSFKYDMTAQLWIPQLSS